MSSDRYSKETHLANVGRDFMIQAMEVYRERGVEVDIGPVWPPDSPDSIYAAQVGLYRTQKPAEPGQR